MRQKIQLSLLSLVALLFAGCSQFSNYSPEKVIEKTLAAEQDALTYYGEIELSGMGLVGIEIVEDAVMKEWRDHDRSRVETETADGEKNVVVVDGTTFLTYDAKEKVAYEIDLGEEEELHFHPREQISKTFSLLRETHDIETIGEETYLGRPTFHLKATKREGAKSVLGDQEMWIDREHWMVLKIITTSGSLQTDMAYTKIDFSPKFDDSLFQLELPDDVVLEKIGEDFLEGEIISVADIPTSFQQPVYIFPEQDDWTVEGITFRENNNGLGHFKILEVNYKHHGLPSMTLTIQANEHEGKEEEMKEMALKLLDDIVEEVSIRGQDGQLFDGMGMNLLEWEEGGITYTIDMIDPALTLEDVLQLTEIMVEIK